MGVQGLAGKVDAVSIVRHRLKPHGVGLVHGVSHQVQHDRGARLVLFELVNYIHATLEQLVFPLAFFKLGFHERQSLIFQLCFLKLLFQFVMLLIQSVVPEVHAAERQDEYKQPEHDRVRTLTAPATAHGRCYGSGAPSISAPSLLCWEEVYSNHRSSKLLKARPTATASCPGFLSMMSFSTASTDGSILWNGFSTSTGSENSWRKASNSPGTLDDPPAMYIFSICSPAAVARKKSKFF